MMPRTIHEDVRYAGRLVGIDAPTDIPDRWTGTPIEKFILSENFNQKIESSGTPELLIATCIEFRYALPIPRMFAYVLRRASGRLIGSEFSLAYILSTGVRHICLVGHNDCGMTKIEQNKNRMIQSLIEQGWHADRAAEFINVNASRYAMSDEIDGLESEYKRLNRLFKHLEIAPLFVDLSDAKLHIPKWYFQHQQEPQSNEPTAVSDEDILLLG